MDANKPYSGKPRKYKSKDLWNCGTTELRKHGITETWIYGIMDLRNYRVMEKFFYVFASWKLLHPPDV